MLVICSLDEVAEYIRDKKLPESLAEKYAKVFEKVPRCMHKKVLLVKNADDYLFYLDSCVC